MTADTPDAAGPRPVDADLVERTGVRGGVRPSHPVAARDIRRGAIVVVSSRAG
jgi:hypothetical protein